MDSRVEILSEEQDYAFGELFSIVRARLRYRRFDGEMTRPVTRINFERGDSVGVLLYDPRRDSVVLVRQFRYPVYAALKRDGLERAAPERAWMLEIVAGVQERGEDAVSVARKELLEEAGYKVRGELEPIATVYPSPGGTSERIALFLAEVDARRPQTRGGGVATEGEDIQVVVLPLAEALKKMERGEIQDGKTIVALQWLALRKGQRV